MGVRVTTSMLVRMSIGNIGRQRARLADLQEQASSGLRINRASDDPVGTSAAMVIRSALDTTALMQRTVSTTRTRVQTTESSLSQTIDLLTRSKELAIQAANGTLELKEREAIAREIESLSGELLSIGNARYSGSRMFGGYDSDTDPFVVSGPFVDGAPSPTVSFVGDSNEIQVEIDQGTYVAVGLDGRRVFMGDGDGDGSPDAGRVDLFAVLGDLREALQADDVPGITSSLSGLDGALAQVTNERTRLGVIEQRLQTQENRLSDRSLRLNDRLSVIQDADVAEVYSELVNQEVALKASLQVAPRMIQPTLMDFLR